MPQKTVKKINPRVPHKHRLRLENADEGPRIEQPKNALVKYRNDTIYGARGPDSFPSDSYRAREYAFPEQYARARHNPNCAGVIARAFVGRVVGQIPMG